MRKPHNENPRRKRVDRNILVLDFTPPLVDAPGILTDLRTLVRINITCDYTLFLPTVSQHLMIEHFKSVSDNGDDYSVTKTSSSHTRFPILEFSST